jgi:hypothetical protein
MKKFFSNRISTKDQTDSNPGFDTIRLFLTHLKN